jgi:hypothetical protein
MWRGRTPGREHADQRDQHMSRMEDSPGHRWCRVITGNARAQAKAPTHWITIGEIQKMFLGTFFIISL